MIAGYQHFLGLAGRLRWDAEAIDLRADAAAWPEVADAALRELIAGFCVGEAGVAEHLLPFAPAAAPEAAACFRAQQRDETRHARFFARVAEEVVGEPVAEPVAALRAELAPAFLELFEVRLPDAARAELGEAVGLYHMVLEGVVFAAGQFALLERLDDRLPGLREGTQLVLRDERWHVGFGTRVLCDSGLGPGAEAAILAEGERAAAVWAPEQAERVVATLRRRLRVVGGRS